MMQDALDVSKANQTITLHVTTERSFSLCDFQAAVATAAAAAFCKRGRLPFIYDINLPPPSKVLYPTGGFQWRIQGG